jgi:nucleoside-diphosphate kinase
MAIERTLSILKPDALQSGVVGKILSKFEESGLKPVAMRMMHLTVPEAEGFYAVHRQRPFFPSLVAYMTSGPVIVQVLEGENAVQRNREVMGATNPANAAEGTIRKLFARSIEANSVHGSDSPENARAEIAYFFSQIDVVRYEWKR